MLLGGLIRCFQFGLIVVLINIRQSASEIPLGLASTDTALSNSLRSLDSRLV